MNEKQCKDCPFLGTIFKHWYGAEKEPYCEYAPEKMFMRKVHRMKECPKVKENQYGSTGNND